MSADLVPMFNSLGEMPWDRIGRIGFFLLLLLVAFQLLKGTALIGRLWKGLEDTMFSNWQLALLGATGIVLSLASGWTTWDGMRNFTGEPFLSAMITFGIQGVMLIVAWLIGESFATGMSQQTAGGGTRRSADAWVGAGLGAAAALAIFYWALNSFGAVTWTLSGVAIDWSRASTVAMYFAMGAIVVAIITFNRRGDLALPYVQSSRVIIKSAVLWVMFLGCMATSVFFSFDSLFSAIFPKEERARAAELRAQNQVAGIIADIGSTIETRRHSAADELFRSEGWKAYEVQLTSLSRQAQGSTAEIERYFNDLIEDRNRSIKQQQERIATAQSTQAGIASKKTTLVEELSRLKSERSTLAGDYTETKTELDVRARTLDAKRIEAMAEDKGAEGTGKQGRGPVYRQHMDELARMQAAYKIQEDRVRDAQKRLTSTDTRVAQIERELAAIDGDLAKLKGEAQTAEQRIKLAQDTAVGDPGSRVDPARVLPVFEAARADFRQQPDQERLKILQAQCSQLLNAMASTPATREKVRGIDCDPKQAAEAAAVVFSLDAGRQAFGSNCAGGDKLAQHTTTDGLFGFARKCLADSGLPSRETDVLRTSINRNELNRDDKANRFVVTWNAFQDGNRLAYLALAIAIAIDGLIFLSGLFAANAVRSPLSDVPTLKARSARQLEGIIDAALLPHTFETARLVLGAMKPMTQRDGFMARIVVDERDPHAIEIQRVLNAGASIGAVRDVQGQHDVYEIRAELFEYLSTVARDAFHANKEHVNLADLERTVGAALLPADRVQANAELVLGYLHPVHFAPTMLEKLGWEKHHGFMAELKLSEVEPDDKRTVRNALNAGAMFERVQRVGDDAGHYYIHGDFYKTLVRLRARFMTSAAAVARVGGPLNQLPALESAPANHKQIAGPAGALPPRLEGSAALSFAPQPAMSDAELRNTYWTRLIRAIGLDAEITSGQLNDPSIYQAIMSAWHALKARAANNSVLSDYLDGREDEQVQLLAEEYSVLLGETEGDARKKQILETINDEIETYRAALLLLPENGLIGNLIDKLEKAAEPDNGLMEGEQRLKEALNQVRQRLSVPGQQNAATWTLIGDLLRPEPPNVVPFKQKH